MNKHEPTINLIAAVALDGSIGAKGKLLWRIKRDLDYYKSRTLDNVVVMGELTYDTLPARALCGRTHVVISEKYSKNPPEREFEDSDVLFTPTPKNGLETAKIVAKKMKRDVYIAGGQSIYEQLNEECDYLFITWVDKVFADVADKFFPLVDIMNRFECYSESSWDKTEDGLPYKFSVYRKKYSR